MSDYLPLPVVVIILVMIVAVAVSLSFYLRRRREDIWREFARKNGLHYSMGDVGPAIRGHLDGREIELQVLAESSDRDTLGFEEIRISVSLDRRPPEDLEVVRISGAVGSMVRIMEHETMSLGDQGFDHEFVVRAHDQEAAQAYLTPARRRVLQDLSESDAKAEFGIREGRLFWQERSMISRSEDLSLRVNQLMTTAVSLDAEDEV